MGAPEGLLMKTRILIGLLSILLTPTISRAAQDNFPDVPEDTWANEALARMKRDGVLIGYPDHVRGQRDLSRYELAVATHAAYANLRNMLDDLRRDSAALALMEPADPKAKSSKEALAAQVRKMKRFDVYVRDLSRLTEHFEKELKALGVDTSAMKSDLHTLLNRIAHLRVSEPGGALRPFPDVPQKHWASEATTRLRRERILQGYPSGKFSNP